MHADMVHQSSRTKKCRSFPSKKRPRRRTQRTAKRHSKSLLLDGYSFFRVDAGRGADCLQRVRARVRASVRRPQASRIGWRFPEVAQVASDL